MDLHNRYFISMIKEVDTSRLREILSEIELRGLPINTERRLDDEEPEYDENLRLIDEWDD